MDVYRCLGSVVFAARFAHVENAADVRLRIVEDKLDFAFVNATLITSPLHLQTAVVQALIAAREHTLRMRTVHAEIVWNLNPTNNISEAIRRYGISDDSSDLVLVHVASWERQDVLERMRAVVHGELVQMANVSDVTDWPTVVEHYNLHGLTGHDERERAFIDNVVVSSVAIKSI